MDTLLDRVASDPAISICQHARKMGLNESTIRLEVKKLGRKSFVRRKQQVIEEKTREKLIDRLNKLLT